MFRIRQRIDSEQFDDEPMPGCSEFPWFTGSAYNEDTRGLIVWANGQRGFPGENMPKFVIEREIPGASRMTEAEIREGSLKSLEALRQLGPEIQWINSFVTDDKIYCIYYSPDEEMIRKHGRISGFPVDRVAAVRRLIDPANFE